ncbi:uncharacterized protein L3040_006325 [Drepanopeziza brunnea f. sp. 'multigermtubi']|uniref:uncharacterized protein n=1 Tax=Drepanopeziza brunnea f. sp. 'multigermtubi' TaxID=698441 RepID=UPI00238C7214|nr:hypothetical protein L3040_006325 [Drepanopeziza brunnea f. sp. 'multigermtubi']
MKLQSKSYFSTLVAMSLLFSRAQAVLGKPQDWGFWHRREIIGYAMIHESRATVINEKNELTIHPTVIPEQIGGGVYLIDKPSGWYVEPDAWFCVVKAKKNKMKKAGKVWIPESYEQRTPDGLEPVTLWNSSEDVLLKYIKYRGLQKSSEALRFSWAKNVNDNWQYQMLIPTAVVNRNDLDVWAKCWKTEEELKKYSAEVIDWQGKYDIRGQPGPDPSTV